MMDAPGLFELTFRDPLNVGATPPLGFIPLAEGEYDNGDCFGVYWPYGREQQSPIVCRYLRGTGALRPAFSSVEVFLRWLEVKDGPWGAVEIDDARALRPRFDRARSLLSNGQPTAAVELLERITDDFSEDAVVWFTLANQQRRVGQLEAAVESTIRAFVSNWAFALPPERVLITLRKLRGRVDDPVVEYSDDLALRFGGTKTNAAYDAMERVTEAYFARGQYVRGLLLRQNYACMMKLETYSFRERYGFDMRAWWKTQTELCERFLEDGRTAIDS